MAGPAASLPFGIAVITREGKMSLLVTMAPPAPPGSSRAHGKTVKRTDMTFASINSNFRSEPIPPRRSSQSVFWIFHFEIGISICNVCLSDYAEGLNAPIGRPCTLILHWFCRG
jgi:hypothetical protein